MLLLYQTKPKDYFTHIFFSILKHELKLTNLGCWPMTKGKFVYIKLLLHDDQDYACHRLQIHVGRCGNSSIDTCRVLEQEESSQERKGLRETKNSDIFISWLPAKVHTNKKRNGSKSWIPEQSVLTLIISQKKPFSRLEVKTNTSLEFIHCMHSKAFLT